MKPDNFSALPQPRSCRVCVVIKAFNEEGRICAAIESALRAVAAVGGEVVLADSCSTDRTVERARAYPIRIVQLSHPQERRCGAGPQLGFQHSRGEFIYLLDGDMEMLEGFLEQALDFMKSHPEVAGVGGRLVEQNTTSLEYIARQERGHAHLQPGCVDRLDGGGLYRRSAIEAAGYFSDRNLHSYEEFDLAVRLRSRGWTLWRLPVDVVRHFGHEAPPYELLRRRWRNGYLCGTGELLRAVAGQPHLRLVLQDLRELRLYLGVLLWWAVLLSVPWWPLSGGARLAWLGGGLMAPLLLMAWRKRSWRKAVYSLVSWCLNAAGLLRGLLQRRRCPTGRIASRVLQELPGFPSRSAPKFFPPKPR
jgi:glycosyltransferase involved in cell wall biosynthesis